MYFVVYCLSVLMVSLSFFASVLNNVHCFFALVFFVHIKQGGMLFVQTLALSTLVEYFGIYTKLFAETATAVPNLPSKEQSRNALEHQFKPSSDGGDQDQLTPLSRTTQRSLSLPPWAPTRRSKQMRRLSSAPRRLQGEPKQDGPPQAAAAGFEGLVSTRIRGFSLVLVQTGASAAGMPAFRIGDWFFSR